MGRDVVQDGVFGSVPADAALLITGPPMTGKYELLLQLIRERADRVVFISTKHGYKRIRTDLSGAGITFDEVEIGIIDCVSYHQSIDTAAVSGPVAFATSPENLTRIGVKFTDVFEQVAPQPGGGTTAVALHSLSHLLMHSGIKNVYQFVQVLVNQTRSSGDLLLVVLDTSIAADETLTSLQSLFDGLVVTRENEAGRREYALRGLTPSASPWIEF